MRYPIDRLTDPDPNPVSVSDPDLETKTETERVAHPEVPKVEPGQTSNSGPPPKSKSPERDTPFPENFTLTEDLAYYGFRRGLDVPTQFEAFRDHALAKGKKHCDWAAAWRTWCRKADEFGHSRYVSPPAACKLPPTDDPVEKARRDFTKNLEKDKRRSLRFSNL